MMNTVEFELTAAEATIVYNALRTYIIYAASCNNFEYRCRLEKSMMPLYDPLSKINFRSTISIDKFQAEQLLEALQDFKLSMVYTSACLDVLDAPALRELILRLQQMLYITCEFDSTEVENSTSL